MQKVKIHEGDITELLGRGVESIYPTKQALKKVLESGKQLRIKHGIDPTGEKIHIGRAVQLRKLKQFQDLGHTIVLIIGDFTARIGDPSDKLAKRPFLSAEEIKKNLKSYLPQIGKVIDLKRTEVHYNSEWLEKFNFHQASRLAESFTIQQMMQRRNFKDRFKRDEDINLHELFYPLMQGYDSVEVKADLELGGTDQLFNLLAGRKIQEHYKQKPQFVMTTKMLIGLDGRKMSTSWGNVINIVDEPKEQFGKIMSMHDDYIGDYLELATDMSYDEIRQRMQMMKAGKLNPRDAKVELARLVVSYYHGKKSAEAADKQFSQTFVKKDTPDDIPEKKLTKKSGDIGDILLALNLASSKSDARRLVQQGGIKVNGEKLESSTREMTLKSGDIVQAGKRRFVKVA